MERGARARLTGHQQTVLGRITRSATSWPTGGAKWVNGDWIGCRGACHHLERKGYIEVRETSGPRGGVHYAYRPVQADRCQRASLHHEDCCCQYDTQTA